MERFNPSKEKRYVSVDISNREGKSSLILVFDNLSPESA
jgi:hypothetical protein